MKKKRFVILDRDGTIIVDKDRLTDPDEIELIPNAVNAIKKLRDLGLGIIVITNQSVVGRGHISLTDLAKIHKRIIDLLSKEGTTIDRIYFCPHVPEDNCLCRKPKTALLKGAMKNHNFDSKLSFVIGDNKSDIKLGKNVNATTILVRTGYGLAVEKEGEVKPDYIVDNLLEAADVIKHQLQG